MRLRFRLQRLERALPPVAPALDLEWRARIERGRADPQALALAGNIHALLAAHKAAHPEVKGLGFEALLRHLSDAQLVELRGHLVQYEARLDELEAAERARKNPSPRRTEGVP